MAPQGLLSDSIPSHARQSQRKAIIEGSGSPGAGARILAGTLLDVAVLILFWDPDRQHCTANVPNTARFGVICCFDTLLEH